MSTSITQLPGRIDAALNAPWKVRAMAIVDAIILNIVILLIGRLVNGEFPVADGANGEQTVGIAAVVLVTALAGLVAWGLLSLLERMTSNAKMIWTAIAVVVFLLSLFGPLGGVNTSSKVILALMHVGGAVTIIPLMRRSA